VAVTLADLAEMEKAQGCYAQAATHYARALQIRRDAFGTDDPRVAETLAAYASVRRKTCHRHAAISVANLRELSKADTLK
jgi:hypothetical protein